MAGSTRVLSTRRVAKHSILLRRQARDAGRGGRPVAWLALVLHKLSLGGVKGASRNTGRVAALMVASADFKSGRRARPGRQVSASVLDLSERTIERQWRLLERIGVAVRTCDGRWLAADARAGVYADPGDRNRWRDRQEWRLVMPDWARDIGPEVDLDVWTDRARALLAEIAYGKPVDNSGAGDLVLRPRPGRVAPSIGGLGLRVWIPARRDQSLRPDGRRESGAPSAHSPTKRSAGGRARSSPRRRIPPEAVVLARQMADSGRFPWLRDAPRYLVAQAVRRLVGWTVVDVADECDRRMRDADFTYSGLHHPVAFLRWLLADADPARPPRQLAHAAQAAQSARHRAPDIERDRAARPPTVTATGQAAREQARRYAIGAAARSSATGRRRELEFAGDQAAAARARRPDPLAELAAELLATPTACVACHRCTPDVAPRRTPAVVELCDACFASIQHVI